MRFARLFPWTVLIGVVVCLGCGGPNFETGEVTGIVTRDGKPLADVAVSFNPDLSKSNSGPASGAITDKKGRYKLVYTIPNNDNPANPTKRTGAVIGWHAVTVHDYKAASEMLPTSRIPEKYTDVGTTPFRFQVKKGEQTIDLAIKGRTN
ncbi:MAG: hypothetical protein ACFCD0_21785 [Gemmataceae bacterium]